MITVYLSSRWRSKGPRGPEANRKQAAREADGPLGQVRQENQAGKSTWLGRLSDNYMSPTVLRTVFIVNGDRDGL